VTAIARVIAVVLTALLLAGCGDPSPRAGASSEPLSLLPSADAFTSAIVATKSLGTARLTVHATHPESGQSAHGEGVTVFGSGQGDMTWSVGEATFRELVNARGIYVQVPPHSGGWEQWPVTHVSPTSGFADCLRGLSVLRDVQNEGPERLGPVETIRYRGWLPLTPDESAQLGLRGTPAPDAREDVTVWIDSFGHAVRIDRHASTSADTVDSRTEFSDYSVLLNLTSPSQDVTATRS
jgi:hypothetical protein